MAKLMPLALTVSYFSKIQIGFTFLVPAHKGNPGKRAVKRVCVFSRTTRESQYHKGITSLDLNDTRDDRVLGCNGISWIIYKQSAPCSRQITTSTPHHSIFIWQMLFLTPNQVSKH